MREKSKKLSLQKEERVPMRKEKNKLLTLKSLRCRKTGQQKEGQNFTENRLYLFSVFPSSFTNHSNMIKEIEAPGDKKAKENSSITSNVEIGVFVHKMFSHL